MPANSHLTVGGSSWSGNPPLATVRQLTSTSTGLYDYTTTTSNVLQGEIDAIVAGGTTALWANYPAINNVNMSTNNIINAGSITAAGTVTAASFVGALTGNSAGTHTGAVVGNVTGNTNGTHTGAVVGSVTGNVTGNIYNTNLTIGGQYSITETADVGSALSNYGNYGTVNISGKGGLGGIVNITADVATPLNPAVTVSQLTAEAKGNYGLITPGTPVGYVPRGGLVSIIARQGLTPTPPAEVTSALFANGEIDLTAYSYGAVPGLIKLSAGANAMYAGAFSPITGIFGNNYIAATIANTMTAGLPPGGIPTLVGTNYFYATLGIGGAGSQIVGNRFQGGVGIDFLQPFPNGDLIIQSNANGTDTVVISGVKSLAMSNGGNITNVGNINLTTINGAAYPPPTVTDPKFNSVSTNQISTGASYISSINGLPMSAYTNVGDATFNSVSTNQISTGASFISSINGLPMSAYTNVGDATFNSISTNKISTARVFMTSINDSITFGNLPIGNNIAGINDLAAATGTFNTSLTVNGNFTGGGNTLLGATRVTGLFRVTGGTGANVATIDTAGAITGTSISVSGAAASGSLAVTNSATIGNGLAVTGGTTLVGTTTAGLVQGATLNFTNATFTTENVTTANITTANIPNANLTNTNTGIINAGTGSLALTYGSISFNGSPYAPTAGTSSNPTFNSISTNSISAAQMFISSINGYEFPGSSSLPPGILSTYVSSFTNFQVSSLQISSATVTGGLLFSTSGANYDITNIFTSTTSANYDAVSSVTNDILNYQMNLTSLPVSFDMGGFLDITAANRALWLNKTIIYSGTFTPGQNPTLNLVGAVTNGDFFDVRNTSASAGLAVWNPYESGGFVMNITPGQFYRFTYTTSWAATANPTQTTQTSLNTFSLVQGWNNTILSTNNSLTLVAGVTNILGFAQLGNTNITDLTAQQVTTSNSQTQIAAVSSLNVSSMNLINGFASGLNVSSANISTATVPLIFNTNFAGRTLTASSITASTVTGCLFNSLVSTVATKAGIDGATQQLLNASVAIYSPIPTLNLQELFTFNDANYSYWNNNGFQAGNQPFWFCTIQNLVVNTSAQVDFYIGDYAVNVQIVYGSLTTNIGNIASGLPQKVRFYFSGGTWYFTNTFSGTSLDNNNSLVINQNISQTNIQTTDSLVLSTSLLQIYGDTYLNNLIGKYFNVSTISSVNTYTGQIIAANTTTSALSTNTISTNSISTNSIATNTLTTNSLITTAPLTVPSLSTTTISSSLVRAANFIASTRVVTPSISTLTSLNGFNTRPLNNPGNILIYTQVFVGGNGSKRADIDTDPFVPGVYTCSAVCRNNQFRTLEATLFYNSRASAFCQNSQGFDNYNGGKWTAFGGFVSFTTQTDGGGDTYDISIYMISGQYFAVGDDPPFPQPSTFFISTATVNTGTPSPVVIGLSSLTGSTITIEANRNISLLANIAPPTYISSGSITIAGTNDVDVLGNIVALGGVTDVDIEALAGDVTVTAASEIILTAPSVDIVGARTLSALSTQQIAIQQTAGSDFVLFNNGDTRMRAVRDAYVQGDRDTYLLANQNMNVRAPNTQYITIQQTGLANDSFIQFQPSGVIDQFSRLHTSIRTLSTNSIKIEQQGAAYNSFLELEASGTSVLQSRGNLNIRTLSTNQVTIYQESGSDFVLFNSGDTRMNAVRDAYVGGNRYVFITAQQEAYLRAQQHVVLESYSSYINLVAQGGSNNIYLTGAFTEVRGNMGFTGSNRYIGNLGHIYGDASAPGGGLAIDSMYGLFFNSSGKNANLYIDSGNLNMINYNSGINIANYNSNGTGNFSLYSASNDMYLTSGTGRDINLNGGRTVSINAAQPGGSFGIYTSTINAGTLVDMNFNCGGNYSVTGGGASQYVTFQNAGTYIQFAGSNIYFGSAGGGLSFNLPVSIGASYSLNMQNAPISNLSNASGTDILITGSNTVSITAPYTTLTGGSNFNILGNNIGITSSNAFDIVATGSGLILDGEFKRKLASTNIPQPIIQYGEDNTGSGTSGSIIVTLPVAYGATSAYVAFATMEDADPAEMSVVRNTASEIEIFWAQGGSGSHVIVWQTIGK